MAWLGSWAKRIKITIDKDRFTSDVTGFPLGIYINNSSGRLGQDLTNIFTNISTDDRRRIAVTESDGITQLYVEIERWDSSSNKAVLWVSKSDWTISSTVDTILYLYYDKFQPKNSTYIGDPGSIQAQNVWDSNFVGVYHFYTNPTSASSPYSFKDSTSNGNHGTPSGFTTSRGSRTQEGDYYWDFTGGNELLFLDDNDDFSFGNGSSDSPFTLESFVNMDDQNLFRLLRKKADEEDNIEWIFQIHSSNYLYLQCYDLPESPNNRIGRGTSNNSENAYVGSWTYYGARYNGNGSETGIDLVRNTSVVDNSSKSTGSYTAMHNLTSPVYIGSISYNGTTASDGKFSEVRISKTNRSNSWMFGTTEVLNDNVNTFSDIEIINVIGQDILASFTNQGIPAEGLLPTIRIRDMQGNLIITDENMVEIGDGSYIYTFQTYDSNENYSIRCDGGPSLPNSERYTFGGNDNYANDMWSVPLSATRASNTTGEAQEQQSYNKRVVINADIGTDGIYFPIGTHKFPVKNINDALLIAESNNIHNLHLESNLTVSHSDIGGMGVISPGYGEYKLTLSSGVSASMAKIKNLIVEGEIEGGLFLDRCIVLSLNNFRGYMKDCIFNSDTNIELFNSTPTFINDCKSDITNGIKPIISVNNARLNIKEHSGSLTVKNKTGDNALYIDFSSGLVEIDSSCVSGSIIVRGIGEVIDNSGPNCNVDYSGTVSNDSTSQAVWSKILSGGNTAEQVLLDNNQSLKRVLGLAHENIFIDNPVYDNDGNLTSARVRIYSNSSDVGTSNGVIGAYQITAPSSAPGRFITWKQIKL